MSLDSEPSLPHLKKSVTGEWIVTCAVKWAIFGVFMVPLWYTAGAAIAQYTGEQCCCEITLYCDISQYEYLIAI